MNTSRGTTQKKTAIHYALLKINTYRNIGKVDRIIRLVVAMALIMSVFFVGTVSADTQWSFEFWNVLPFLGFYPGLTAFLGWDPVYELLGISTHNTKTEQHVQLNEELRREDEPYRNATQTVKTPVGPA